MAYNFKILYARNLIDVNKNQDAEKILKDIIIAYPESSGSLYVLNLFWQANQKNSFDSLKLFLSALSNKNQDKEVYGLAGIIFAHYDKNNTVNDLDNIINKYTSDNIKQTAMFGKFLYYINEASNINMAKNVLTAIDKQYPNSAISEDAHIQLGDNVKPLGKKLTLEENLNSFPKDYSLSQNYPNPFNPSTIIHYEIPNDGLVTLKIYDELGREVKTLIN